MTLIIYELSVFSLTLSLFTSCLASSISASSSAVENDVDFIASAKMTSCHPFAFREIIVSRATIMCLPKISFRNRKVELKKPENGQRIVRRSPSNIFDSKLKTPAEKCHKFSLKQKSTLKKEHRRRRKSLEAQHFGRFSAIKEPSNARFFFSISSQQRAHDIRKHRKQHNASISAMLLLASAREVDLQQNPAKLALQNQDRRSSFGRAETGGLPGNESAISSGQQRLQEHTLVHLISRPTQLYYMDYGEGPTETSNAAGRALVHEIAGRGQVCRARVPSGEVYVAEDGGAFVDVRFYCPYSRLSHNYTEAFRWCCGVDCCQIDLVLIIMLAVFGAVGVFVGMKLCFRAKLDLCYKCEMLRRIIGVHRRRRKIVRAQALRRRAADNKPPEEMDQANLAVIHGKQSLQPRTAEKMKKASWKKRYRSNNSGKKSSPLGNAPPTIVIIEPSSTIEQSSECDYDDDDELDDEEDDYDDIIGVNERRYL